MIGFAIYLSGAILVFASFYLYNRAIENSTDISRFQKPEEKVSFMTAFTASIFSWGTVLVVLVAIFVLAVIYLITESGYGTKINDWFRQDERVKYEHETSKNKENIS